MLFPLRVIRRIHREGFRCIPEAIRFRIALHRQRPFLQTETALRQAEEDGYQAFIRRHEAPLSAPFTPTMRLSFLIPTYNTPPELLRALADSLLHQSCGAWEACFYDGASTRADTRELLQALTQEDNRFRVTFGAENRGIAGNTNAALTMATGKFVALCDHDDLLAPDAVRCILEAAQDGADFVYTDEDKVSADGTHFFEPHLKPDFAPDSLRSGNYICHITAASRALMNAVGGLRPGFDGSQDHDLALRLSENAAKITHIPRILYHWRMLDTSFSHQKAQTCADAAARAVADGVGHYNPLFIYGDSGLGKTHLIYAIAHQIRTTRPSAKIIYIKGDDFINEFIELVRAGRGSEFRAKYRDADLLLVDDIQFIAGKESTQEEFFHTFNSLHDAHKQIVIASDRPAKEIKSLEERLRTRFEWGLTADVQPPDFETRVAIVKRKAELLHLDLPEDVAEFIANHLKNNIRQLEGAVKKLNAYYMLEGIQPVISVAQNAIKDILNETQPVPVTIEKIVGEVSRTFNVSPADIRGTKRNANVASARRVAIYILREVTGMSMEEIGREFSGRDHSTIVYSLKTMERDMKNDQHLRETVSDIIKNVKA